MYCGGGRGCIEGNMRRVITVSPLGELQMATQGCYMAEALKGANSQPFSFILVAENRLPRCACTQYHKSPLTKQNGNQRISPAISQNLSLVVLSSLIILKKSLYPSSTDL